MTKKDFIAVANVLKKETPHHDHTIMNAQHDRIIQALANCFQSQNPNFNRRRWLDYIAGKCGPNGGKV
jgi:hypothetical protein